MPEDSSTQKNTGTYPIMASSNSGIRSIKGKAQIGVFTISPAKPTIAWPADAMDYLVYYRVEGSKNYEAVGSLSIQAPLMQAVCPDAAGQVLYIQNGKAAEYTLDLEQFVPSPPFGHFGGENDNPPLINRPALGGDWGYTIAGSAYFTKDAITSDLWTLRISVNAVNITGEKDVAVITAKYTGSNFLPFGLPLTIRAANRIPVTITGVKAQGWTYDGKARPGYSGTPSPGACTGTLTAAHLDESGNPLPGEPKNAGNYKAVLAVPADNEDHTGSLTPPFTVKNALITLKADDKQAVTGSELPELTYTPSGLAAASRWRSIPPWPMTAAPDGGYALGALTATDSQDGEIRPSPQGGGARHRGRHRC